jgi:hypothetical protein
MTALSTAPVDRPCDLDEAVATLRSFVGTPVTVCIAGSRYSVATFRGAVRRILTVDHDPAGAVCVQVENAAVIVCVESLSVAIRREKPSPGGAALIALELRFNGGPIVEISPDAVQNGAGNRHG